MSTDDSPEREVFIYDREGLSRGSLEDEESPLNVSASEDVKFFKFFKFNGKPKSRRTPRREVRWLDLGTENRSLESIKRHFEDRLDRFQSSSSNYLLRRVTSSMDNKIRHNLHQCPGYLREEITLASDVSKSVIVSHAFPSHSEVCSICGQLVQYDRTEPSIEKLEDPRYPSQYKFQNKASLSPLSSSMEDGLDISHSELKARSEAYAGISSTKYLVLPFHSFSYSYFFIDPRSSLHNTCQKLSRNNTSNLKMPQYVYNTRGPLHNVTWTVTVYSQFLSIISS